MAEEQGPMTPYTTFDAWPPWSVVARHMERLTADYQQNTNNTKGTQTIDTGGLQDTVQVGYARCTFAGHLFGAEYLDFTQGDPLVIDHSRTEEGWAMASKIVGEHWHTGWIPATYWTMQKKVTTKLEDFFCVEMFGTLADAIVKYVGWPWLGRGTPSDQPIRRSPTGALIQTTKAIADYITVNMEERRLKALVIFWESAFPTIRADVERYGMPARLHNFPEWSCWQLQIEVYYQHYSPAAEDYGEGWHHWEYQWHDTPAGVKRAIDNFQSVAGVYRHVQFCVEEWCWDYLDQAWAPRNFI